MCSGMRTADVCKLKTDAPYTGEAPSAEAVPPAAAPSDVDAAKQDIVARTNVLRAERDIAALTATIN